MRGFESLQHPSAHSSFAMADNIPIEFNFQTVCSVDGAVGAAEQHPCVAANVAYSGCDVAVVIITFSRLLRQHHLCSYQSMA